MTDDEVRSILTDMTIADVVTHGAEGLDATPLPLVWLDDPAPYGRLIGHVQRNNTQWRDSEALVIVHAGDHYVSPQVLPSHRAHGSVVPTWNYRTLHLRGPVVAHDDRAWTRWAVDLVTRRHEPAGGWTSEEPPGDYVERMLRAVVGIEIPLRSWVGKAKMAQNKTPDDVVALAESVAANGDDEAAHYLQGVSLPAAQARAALIADLRAKRNQP